MDRHHKYAQYRVILLTMRDIEFMIISEINRGAINGEGVMRMMWRDKFLLVVTVVNATLLIISLLRFGWFV